MDAEGRFRNRRRRPLTAAQCVRGGAGSWIGLLLIGAGLFVGGLPAPDQWISVSSPTDVHALSTELAVYGYSEERAVGFYRDLVERALPLPEVESVALINMPPLTFWGG